jgi:hypothetical protein
LVRKKTSSLLFSYRDGSDQGCRLAVSETLTEPKLFCHLSFFGVHLDVGKKYYLFDLFLTKSLQKPNIYVAN